MNDNSLVLAFSKFDTGAELDRFEPITAGHINRTYAVFVKGEEKPKYVMQKINAYIFKDPVGLIENIKGVCAHVRKKVEERGGDPMRETLILIPTVDGEDFLYNDEGAFRLYYFITDATAHQSANKPGLLQNAAEAFGMYQRLLSDYPAETLHETIPNFHNTVSRYADFEQAMKEDKAGRLAECADEIAKIVENEPYAHIIVDALANGEIPLRVTHNDTKLNNIMIDDNTGKGICVIDLDTVMPGSLLYDFGDSIRFAACNSAEDETDLSKVYLRLDLFEEYTKGFLAGVGENITAKEIELLPMSAFILTYELVLRFLGDYLNGDVYFQTHRDKHNLERARTQLTLALDIKEKLPAMAEIVKKYAK